MSRPASAPAAGTRRSSRVRPVRSRDAVPASSTTSMSASSPTRWARIGRTQAPASSATATAYRRGGRGRDRSGVPEPGRSSATEASGLLSTAIGNVLSTRRRAGRGWITAQRTTYRTGGVPSGAPLTAWVTVDGAPGRSAVEHGVDPEPEPYGPLRGYRPGGRRRDERDRRAVLPVRGAGGAGDRRGRGEGDHGRPAGLGQRLRLGAAARCLVARCGWRGRRTPPNVLKDFDARPAGAVRRTPPEATMRTITRVGPLLAAAALLAAVPPVLAHAATTSNAAPAFAAATTFNVRDYGAKGNGTTLDDDAIDRAIAAASAAPGGTVLFPTGTYQSRSIHLRSNVTLQLNSGATIRAASSGFDPPEPNAFARYQDFGHSHFHNALLWGDGISNLT